MQTLRTLCVAALASCHAGPKYHVPPAPVPAATAYKGSVGWKLASPSDAIPRGAWWSMFHEPELDALERRLNIDNQSIAQAIASYEAARAQVRAAIANYYPTVTAAPAVTAFRTSASGIATSAIGGTQGPGQHTIYTLPLDVTWQPDLFGRVHYLVEQNRAGAQVSAADLENTRLVVQALLAQTYFQLRGEDALIDILAATIALDTEVADLTRDRYRVGLAEEVAVIQAELTLQVARVQAANAATLRATLESSIATLVGVPATTFTMAHRASLAAPPEIPLGTPSQLLERRPDIAAAERRMAAANAAIGLAQSAYFPVVSLIGSQCALQTQGACAGFISSTIGSLLSWPSRVWAIGASAAEVLFDGGQRGANVDLANAQYAATVAAYRQAVLDAFQQVEQSIAQVRGIADQADLQRAAVSLAQRAFELERGRFERGLDPYIDLALQQTALLSAQLSLADLQIQEMTSTVALIEALGGGWSRSELPR